MTALKFTKEKNTSNVMDDFPAAASVVCRVSTMDNCFQVFYYTEKEMHNVRLISVTLLFKQLEFNEFTKLLFYRTQCGLYKHVLAAITKL